MSAAPARVAVLGFGNQGEAQALNLRDAGVEVVVGARPGGVSASRAAELGFATMALGEAVRSADTVALLLPDEVVPPIARALVADLRTGAVVVFAHGFNLVYSDLPFPSGADVVVVSPTAPGRVLRQVRERGGTLPVYLAVHRDGTGNAWARAGAYATAIGGGPFLRTTVREETEVDLFGEQAVLCGGMNALVTTAFEVLVAKGYSPEIAYLECVHQLKYLADLLHERGVAGLRKGISGTALYGDLSRGPQVIGAAAREAMTALLEQIRSGAFAGEWAREVAGGRRWLDREVERAAGHPIEEARRRALAGDGGAPAGGGGNRATPCPKPD